MPSANSVSPLKIAVANRLIHAIHEKCIVYLVDREVFQMWRLWPCCGMYEVASRCVYGRVLRFQKINKISSRLPMAFYAGLRIADLPGPWHYKVWIRQFTKDSLNIRVGSRYAYFIKLWALPILFVFVFLLKITEKPDVIQKIWLQIWIQEP